MCVFLLELKVTLTFWAGSATTKYGTVDKKLQDLKCYEKELHKEPQLLRHTFFWPEGIGWSLLVSNSIISCFDTFCLNPSRSFHIMSACFWSITWISEQQSTLSERKIRDFSEFLHISFFSVPETTINLVGFRLQDLNPPNVDFGGSKLAVSAQLKYDEKCDRKISGIIRILSSTRMCDKAVMLEIYSARLLLS